MSLFGSMMGDFDDDMFMNNPMNMMQMQMRNMNRMMNTLMPDPFNMLMPNMLDRQTNALMERNNGHPGMNALFSFPMANMNMNRLLNPDMSGNAGASYCSSSVISMSSGPDGRPQIYQATTSSKTGPGGVREVRKTVQDSAAGVKKMAIGHHIGDRAHIIEKEQDLRSGQLEERQEFINLDEEEAEDFDREFSNKARGGGSRVTRVPHGREILTIEDLDDDDTQQRRPVPAIMPASPAPRSKSVLHPHPYKNVPVSRRQRIKQQQHQEEQIINPHIQAQRQQLPIPVVEEVHEDDDDDEYEQEVEDAADNNADDDVPQVIIEEPDDDDEDELTKA